MSFALWFGLALAGPAGEGGAPAPPPPRAATSTAAAAGARARAATPEERALARYLYVLENWELVTELDLVELLPVFEEEGP